jgi:LysR family hydrogen peroxide-inducible transcriptional activator
MDLQQLRYFIAVAQELHFNRAAKKCHVTQPTLSQGIKKLEDSLGAALLERTPQNVRLTSDGKKFLVYAASALSELEKGAEEIQDKGAEVSGTVRLGVIPTICPYLMPEIITKLKKTAPRLVIDLFEDTTSALIEHLKQGVLDLGILALPIPDKSLASRTLFYEPFYLAVSKNHTLASRKTVSRKDIENEKLLILQEGHCFGEQSLEFCRTSRRASNIIFEGSSLTSVEKLTTLGEGITLMPKMAIDEKRNPNISYIPFSPEKPARKIGAIWRLSTPLNRAHRLLLETANQALNSKK